MYRLTTRDPVACSECGHTISGGSPCTSEIPEQLHELENVRTEAFRHFHIICRDCPAGKSCYQVYASRQTPIVAQGNTGCTYCHHPLSAGEPVFHDSFLFLASNSKTEAADARWSGLGLAGLRGVRLNRAASFRDLSDSLKLKFINAGLGGRRGLRTFAEAERLFNSTVPRTVRNSGEGAIRKFLRGKQASHIESVSNAPSKAKSPGNIVWESAKNNIRRGPRNMNRMERLAASAKNGAHSVRIVGKAVAANAGRGAAMAAVLEAPVSTLENGIHCARGRKSRGEATKDTAMDVGKAAALGGAMATGITVAGALGGGPFIATTAPVAVPLGLGLFALSSAQRIGSAMAHDADALVSTHLRFHTACEICETGVSCYDAFATAVSSIPKVVETE